MTPVTIVMSGGQIGADIAGLRAAKALGLATGGWATKGFKIRGGRNPELASIYGLREHQSEQYPPRTQANVRDSDGTIRLAHDFSSRGELCTIKAVRDYGRPCFDVLIKKNDDGYYIDKDPEDAAGWLRRNNIQRLNIAGNADRNIEDCVEEFLKQVLA